MIKSNNESRSNNFRILDNASGKSINESIQCDRCENWVCLPCADVTDFTADFICSKCHKEEYDGEEDEEELPTYIQSPGSATYDSLKDFATKEPEQVARVLKTWISS